MIKRFLSKAVILTALLASGASLAQTNPSPQPAQPSTQAQLAASTVKLELFVEPPTESSQALSALEIGASGGSLNTLEVPNEVGKARYLRVSVTSSSGVQSYVYRVIVAPSTGRVFVLTPDRKAVALNNFLASSGLEVGKDKTVKLGSKAEFSSDAAASGASSTTATPSSTPATTTPATTTPADTSATKPADTSSTTATPPASTPANTSTPTKPADSSTPTTPADSSTKPADSSTTTTPADNSATKPADSSTTTPSTANTPSTAATPSTTTPADSSTATSADAKALTEPVNATLGKVQLTVIPTGASAPESSASNFILAPIDDAKDAKSSVQGNVVTLSYGSESNLEDVSAFYDDQLTAQGFTRDDANAANKKSADEIVSVYKRGSASVTVTVKADKGTYTVTVDLGNLAQATGG